MAVSPSFYTREQALEAENKVLKAAVRNMIRLIPRRPIKEDGPSEVDEYSCIFFLGDGEQGWQTHVKDKTWRAPNYSVELERDASMRAYELNVIEVM